jgi:hypothetical protein
MTTRSPLHDRIETVADEAELEESTTASGTCPKINEMFHFRDD